jgi:tRNA(Ile2) C34 agmatinyltransferase TiaS
MPRFTTDPVCPKCGGALRLEDKTTFTGRDLREYRCVSCGNLVVEDYGVALWQVLHDSNEEMAEAARQRARKPWRKFWGK